MGGLCYGGPNSEQSRAGMLKDVPSVNSEGDLELILVNECPCNAPEDTVEEKFVLLKKFSSDYDPIIESAQEAIEKQTAVNITFFYNEHTLFKYKCGGFKAIVADGSTGLIVSYWGPDHSYRIPLDNKEENDSE